jgi:hypothetical protein
MPESIFPPPTSYSCSWPRKGSSEKHSSTWGLTYPIGYHDTPPIPKFGKVYKVFKDVYNLKGGDLMHLFEWFFD